MSAARQQNQKETNHTECEEWIYTKQKTKQVKTPATNPFQHQTFTTASNDSIKSFVSSYFCPMNSL